MSEPMIQVRVQPPGGTIMLNRPDRRNALSRQLIARLSEAFDDLHQERKVRAVILTGAEPAFCAGMDLAEMRETCGDENPFPVWHDDALAYKELLETMLRFPKPIIAAVNGPAVAGGAGLVLASDLALAAPTARFGVPEPKRGLVAGIVSPLLNFRIGAARSAELLLTGRLIEAERAAQYGIFHEIVEHDLLWARAQQIAGEIAESAPEAIQLTKRMLNETIGEHLGMLLSATNSRPDRRDSAPVGIIRSR